MARNRQPRFARAQILRRHLRDFAARPRSRCGGLSQRKAPRFGLLYRIEYSGRGVVPDTSIYSGAGEEMKQDLAACYGQEQLPRYTSYPTAPHFSTDIGPDIHAEWLRAIPTHATASLYLHVPFCRSMCWYCGCHTSVANRDEPIAVYEAALRCEIDLVSRQIDRRLKVNHIHFGGERRPSWRRRPSRI